MRLVTILFVGLLASGCSMLNKPKPVAPATQPAVRTALDYEPAEAMALVFVPEQADISIDMLLARDNRGIFAFMGYESLIEEYAYVRMEDRQNLDSSQDYVNRRAYSYRVTARSR